MRDPIPSSRIMLRCFTHLAAALSAALPVYIICRTQTTSETSAAPPVVDIKKNPLPELPVSPVPSPLMPEKNDAKKLPTQAKLPEKSPSNGKVPFFITAIPDYSLAEFSARNLLTVSKCAVSEKTQVTSLLTLSHLFISCRMFDEASLLLGMADKKQQTEPLAPAEKSALLLAYARIEAGKKDFDKALQFCRQAAGTDPDSPEIQWFTAHIYRLMKEYDTAQKILTETLQKDNITPLLQCRLLTESGKIHSDTGNVTMALKCRRKAVFAVEDSSDADHPDAAEAYLLLAKTSINLQQYDTAMKYAVRSLNIKKKLFQADDPEIFYNLLIAGSAAEKLLQYDEAREFYIQALNIRKTPEKNPGFALAADAYAGIARTYSAEKMYDHALQSREELLKFSKAHLASDELALAEVFCDAANDYLKVNEFSTALEYLHTALDIRQKICGENSIEAAETCDLIARADIAAKDPATALNYWLSALEIRKQISGENTPDYARNCNNLGVTYEMMGQYGKALEFHRKALDIRLNNFPDDKADIARNYHSTGVILYRMKKYSEARDDLQKAVNIATECHGKDDPVTGLYINALQFAEDKIRE